MPAQNIYGEIKNPKHPFVVYMCTISHNQKVFFGPNSCLRDATTDEMMNITALETISYTASRITALFFNKC